MRILMLGNSFTFANDMPTMLADILNAEVVHHTRGGAHLAEQLNPDTEMGSRTQTAFQKEKWDYVVLQEYSTGPLQSKERFFESVKVLCDQVRENGAVPILYATWAFKRGGIKLEASGLNYDEMYHSLYDAYHKAGAMNSTSVADVGQAFYEAADSEDLFAHDDYHPNKAGSHLAAETIAAVIITLEQQRAANSGWSDQTPVPDPSDNRLRTLYVYQILRQYTDETHTLSAPEIRKILQEKYGVDVYRATLRRDIGVLRAAGLDVISDRTKTRNYHLADQTFSTPDLRLLIDAVQSSKFITEQKSDALIEKLYTLTSAVNSENLRRTVHVTGKAKSDNEKGYYIVDAVNDAIHKNQKIQFFYFDYDGKKKRQLMNGGAPYTVSPYDLIWDGDYYYLVGFCDERDDIRVFRVDRIESRPALLEEPAVKHPKGYRVDRYTHEVFRMFATQETSTVELFCKNSAMKALIDQFGMKVRTKVIDKDHFLATVKVCAGPNFFRWIFGWGDMIQIKGPEAVSEKYRIMLQEELSRHT